MKILLTGGTGFLGAALWPMLQARGHSLKLLQRSSSKAAEKAGVEVVQASLTQRDAVKKALKGVDVVYHLAGRVSWDPKDAREMGERRGVFPESGWGRVPLCGPGGQQFTGRQ